MKRTQQLGHAISAFMFETWERRFLSSCGRWKNISGYWMQIGLRRCLQTCPIYSRKRVYSQLKALLIEHWCVMGTAAVRASTTQLLFRLLLWLTSHRCSWPNRLSMRLQSEVVDKCVSVGDFDAAKKTASVTEALTTGSLNLFVTDSVKTQVWVTHIPMPSS